MPLVAKPYAKPPKTLNALLRHLRAKGLSTRGQTAKAHQALSFIGYHRLLIYMRPLQDVATKRFHPNVTFDDILALYDFDRKLRLLCLDAIERIEVAFRAAISNTLANDKNCGPHFYLESIHFEEMKTQRDFLKNVIGLRESDLAVKHYYQSYNTPSLPPIWVILEQLSIGQLSRLLAGLHEDHRKSIAACFGYDETVITSWLKSITLLRNLCAHHSRVWNASITSNTPKYAKAIAVEFPPQADRGRLFCRAVAIQALMREIDPSADWKDRFKALMANLPTATLTRAGMNSGVLGLVPNWEARPFWS
ncbi:Abi-like protein [compost metagenome]